MRRLVLELRAILAAAVFFSRLPVPSRPSLRADDLRRAATYWPLIGVPIGLAMAGVCCLAAHAFPPPIAAGLGLGTGVLLTGALELDGTADVCDGFGGAATREGALALMHRSGLSSFGAIGVVMTLGLRWQAMAALPIGLLAAALVAATASSRAVAVAVMAVLPYVRGEDSRARPVVGRLHLARLILVAATGALPLLLLPAGERWAGMAATAAIWLGCVSWFRHRLGGYTGDCVGATQHLAELAFLLAVLAAA